MRTRIAPIVAVAPIILLLAGCFAIPAENVAEQVAEEAIENMAGESGVDVDIDAGDGADVPADFPAELPLPDGRLTSAFAIDGSYQLTFEVADAEPAARAIVDELVAAGYALEADSDMGELHMYILAGPIYRVSVSAMTTAEPQQLSYSVGVIN